MEIDDLKHGMICLGMVWSSLKTLISLLMGNKITLSLIKTVFSRNDREMSH